MKPEDKDVPSVFNKVKVPESSDLQKELEDMFEVKTKAKDPSSNIVESAISKKVEQEIESMFEPGDSQKMQLAMPRLPKINNLD
jgi:hypothetical protein